METVLNWFKYYLVGRRQQVRISSTSSSLSVMFWWGAAARLSSWLYAVLAVLPQLIESRCICPGIYADDTQIELCAPNEQQSLQIRLSACIDHDAE